MQNIKKKYAIKKENFWSLRYSSLRKTDPGEKFPWQRLSKHKLGVWYKNIGRNFKVDKK